MAEIRSMYKCLLILVALIACHSILSAEGRQIKSINKKETANKQGSSSSSINSKKALKETMSFGEANSEDDFRPTTPGISPGVGHSFSQDQQKAESKLVADNSKKAGHFMTGGKDDFRPTTPGRSPGIGHAAEPNA
ncbi:hypothetical protein Ddye_010491 [Dipteronia dyeriana]|uniref:Precursor of CEP9 n=1 Tax=Dipteronia dyeriana TaxID=168575 RepID=A0AAD9XDE5_9ROSI|nr:hypothetical protein Ddye_010491 [Dipteronia dyeriana]